jgi:hypothetical protein
MSEVPLCTGHGGDTAMRRIASRESTAGVWNSVWAKSRIAALKDLLGTTAHF